MKKTGYVTFGAIMSALCVVLMLVSYFPYLTYSVPAVASLFVMVSVIELGVKRSVMTYIVAAVLSLLTAEPEAALMFVCFFGYYPILKAVIEKLRSKPLKIVFKFAVFNASIVIVYLLLMRVMGIDDGLSGYSCYAVAGLLVCGNVSFLLYDMVILKMSGWYIYRYHSRIQKYLKK